MGSATTLPATSSSSSFAEPIWRAVDERAAGRLPRFEEDWSEEGRVLVDVSSAVGEAGTWRVGERVTIDIPQLGDRYQATIDRIDDGPGGYSRSARGLIRSDNGQNRRAVVTVGPTRVLAYIDTPQGSYQLVGDARLGWLLPSSSMMEGWDFSRPDYILPDGAEPSGAY